MRFGTWALVPARSFRTGKSRLAADPRVGEHRAALARSLFDRVINVLARSPSIAGVLVATDGADVAAAAGQHGADVLFDHPPATLATIVDRGLVQLAERGARAALVIMADLPLVGTSHIEELCVALAGADLVLAPDRDLLGTNALAVRLPAPLTTRFGNRDSFPRHLTASGALRVAVVRAHGLAFDLDHPADLDELSFAPTAGRSGSDHAGSETAGPW